MFVSQNCWFCWNIWLTVSLFMFCLLPVIYRSRLRRPPKKLTSELKTQSWCWVTRRDRSPCHSTRYNFIHWITSALFLFTLSSSSFLFPPGPVVFPLQDLQGVRRAAGQEFLPSSCCTDLLPSGTCPARLTPTRPGALLWVQLEEQRDCSCSHIQIRRKTKKGEQRERCSY